MIPADLEQITPELVSGALKDLKKTLAYATPQEVKALLQESIHEVLIPPTGEARLVYDPAELLEYYIDLVTPRGVAKVANTFAEVYLLENGRFRLVEPPESQAA